MGSNARTGKPVVSALVVLLLMGAVVARAEEPHWGYNCEEGAPFEWGLLDAQFAECLEGQAQSPIDINTTGSLRRPLTPLGFRYRTTNLRVVNNGHTVEAYLPAGSVTGTLRIGARTYLMERFHWHTPSEHWINGNVLEMELHMVHQASDGENLVVGALIRTGHNNDELDKIWNVLPELGDPEVNVTDFSLARLLPAGRRSYRYNGSLTTPPCGQGIRWVVLAEPVEMSQQQIEKFRTIFYGNEKFPVGNARPLQPRNGRRVVTDAGGH